MDELNVKIGDKVLFNGDIIATVVKVTPTGRITTDKTGVTQFNKYGKEIGKNIQFKKYISIPTKEDYERLRGNSIKRKAVKLMRACNTENITVKQAERIIEILENGGGN